MSTSEILMFASPATAAAMAALMAWFSYSSVMRSRKARKAAEAVAINEAVEAFVAEEVAAANNHQPQDVPETKETWGSEFGTMAATTGTPASRHMTQRAVANLGALLREETWEHFLPQTGFVVLSPIEAELLRRIKDAGADVVPDTFLKAWGAAATRGHTRALTAFTVRNEK